ncbi:MAG TPA: YcxB family protein [Candidatus Polarisedimenticolia bacterium]|nr:YcxB family protein [Candidatus Polarisedimenticolia bacterium]
MGSPISFTVQLTPHDLFRANLSLLLRRHWWAILLPIPAALAALYWISQTTYDPGARPIVIVSIIPVWFLWVFGRVYLGARSQFRQQKGLREPNRYTISDDGIQIESPSSSDRMDWTHIYQAYENKRFFFLHLSRNLRCIIPKRALPDEASIAQFRQLARAHVKGKVRLFR